MASTIAAVTTSGGGVVTTADASGNLNLLAGTTTVVALTTAGAAVTGALSSTTGANFATSSGSVGVGTGSPSAKLHSYATSGTTTTLGRFEAAIGSYTGTSLIAANTLGSSSTYNLFSCITDSDGDAGGPFTQFLVCGDGSVGIGTSSPSSYGSPLTVYAATNPTLSIASGNANAYFRLYSTSDNNMYLTNTGGAMTVITANTERMRIDLSGNLLVGTTGNSPSAKLSSVTTGNWGLFAQCGNGNSAIGTTNTSGTASYTAVQFFNNGTTFTAVGNITVSGSATAYNTSSDYRLKNTIAPMTGALDKVALLKPCTYKWNVDGSDGQGFIAHELQEVVEGCVTGKKDGTKEEEYEVTPAVPAVVDADGVETTPAVQAVKGTRTVPSYQGVDTSFLVATLTAAIQELKAIIDTQATRIAALEAK